MSYPPALCHVFFPSAVGYLFPTRLVDVKEKKISSVQLTTEKDCFKGCRMGPLFVPVSPCFRENIVVTCKIGSFLCSLDTLLQKNVIVFFFRSQISKWRSFEKRTIFGLLFTFFSHQGKVTKIPSARISLTCIHVFCSHYWLFLPYELWKNTNLSGMVSLWCDSWCWFLFAPFWNNQKITKWWAKLKLECVLLICIYTCAKFIVICKPQTLNDGVEDSVQYRNCKKKCFLAAAILLFIGKIIITW